MPMLRCMIVPDMLKRLPWIAHVRQYAMDAIELDRDIALAYFVTGLNLQAKTSILISVVGG